MIHIDHNHHTNEHSDHQIIDWTEDHLHDFVTNKAPPVLTPLDSANSSPHTLPGRGTPVDNNEPTPSLSGPSSPASPADDNSASPTQPGPSSLSPIPDSNSPNQSVLASQHLPRPDSPLSELLPPPDEGAKVDLEGGQTKGNLATLKLEGEDRQVSSTGRASSVDSIPTPSSSTLPLPSPTHPGDPKVASILEINSELFKVCMAFQTQSGSSSSSDPKYLAYTQRIESNLQWLSRSADPKQAVSTIPLLESPPAVDFTSMERIQQLYSELPTIFARSIARRQLVQSDMNANMPNPLVGVKRDRPEELRPDMMNKRRDTGDTKVSTSPSSMMPPPSVPSPPQAQSIFPMPNSSMSPPHIPEGRPSTPSSGGNRPMRPPQLPNPLPNTNPPPIMNPMLSNPQTNGVPGQPTRPMPGQFPPQFQQFAQLLQQNPEHQFVQMVMKATPNFNTLSFQDKVQRMFVLNNNMRQQRQEQQQNAMGNTGSMQSNMTGPQGMMNGHSGGMQTSPTIPQSMVGMSGGGLDPRAMSGQSGPPNIQSMTPQQRQQFMLLQQQQMQQSRGATGNAMGGMMMSPQQQQQQQQQQQMAFLQQQQERQRQDQQRMGQSMSSQQAGSPHLASSMLPGTDNNFPALRSNAIPGIARSARSPTDSAPSPMTPRGSSRPASFGQDDYQRMMMAQQQQQQQQQGRPMSQGGGFGDQQQMPTPNWQQQQQQQIQMSGGFGMQRPGSATGGGNYGGAPGQNWSQPSPSYSFSGSSNQSDLGRHMTSPPGAQHMHSQNPNPTEHALGGDFDPMSFNWAP